MGSIGLPELIIIFVVCLAFILPWWKIFQRSGHPGALSLLMLVPVVNLVIILWFAFAEWPIERELKALRNRGVSTPRP